MGLLPVKEMLAELKEAVREPWHHGTKRALSDRNRFADFQAERLKQAPGSRATRQSRRFYERTGR